MRKLLLGLAAATAVLLVADPAQAHDRRFYSSPSYGAYGGISTGRYYPGRGHYDYYPGRYVRHGNHWDYIPGHYHYHRGTHGHRDFNRGWSGGGISIYGGYNTSPRYWR